MNPARESLTRAVNHAIAEGSSIVTEIPVPQPKPDIIAVIWTDFIPLHLYFADEEEAIAKAQDMNARATLAGIVFPELRAVRLRDGSNELETLWQPEASDENPA